MRKYTGQIIFVYIRQREPSLVAQAQAIRLPMLFSFIYSLILVASALCGRALNAWIGYNSMSSQFDD